jgi:hypothetical protein
MSQPQANGISDQALPYEEVGRLGEVTPDGRKIVERAKKMKALPHGILLRPPC